MANAPPFALKSSQQFRPGPPPVLKSARCQQDYNEVKKLGSTDSIHRTAQQTELARFWSVNFIAEWFATVRAIADSQVPEFGDKARLFALAAIAAAGLSVNPRTFRRLSQAQQEAVDAQIYQGIHFRSADEEGSRQGIRVDAWAFNNYLKPRQSNGHSHSY